MDVPTFLDVPTAGNPQARLKRAEKRIESYEKMAEGIKKEIEIVNKKHTEQQMALQRCKRDSQASKPIEKEILDLKKRQEFLKSNLMLERCNDALQRDRRQLEMLKNSQQIEDEMKMEMGWP